MGSPGRIVRTVGDKELAMIARGAESYQHRALRYRTELLEQLL
jgi:carbonic anhydrase/acetyltransferase-like protein (isoleucine patch superfamily)